MVLSYEETLRNQKIATEESAKAHRLRKIYSQKVTSGDLTFHQLVDMAKDPDLKALGRINVLKLLAQFPGWTTQTARYAFVRNGLSDSLRVKDSDNQRIRIIISTLMDSSAASWQKRVTAPPGWPWFGNIANVLKDFDEGSLPRELRDVRYRFSDEEEIKETPAPEPTPHEVSEEITEVLGGRRRRPGNLDDIFAEDEEPDIPPVLADDGLDDLLGDDDDDDDDDDDTLSDEEINKMLGF